MVSVDSKQLNFSVDPMMQHKINMQIQSNPKFAEIINVNITPQFYGFLKYKVQMRENINVACKGETRSGKSTVILSLCTTVSSWTGVPYMIDQICANESEYYSKVRNATFNQTYHIDEQKESKFGSGSFREEMGIMDVQNIIAKLCVHTFWIYPTDFIARNSIYGLETYGKDLKYKIIRCIVYDLRKSMLGIMSPLGIVYVPKYQDVRYQQMPEPEWSQYRLDNKYKLNRPDFDSLTEELYEVKKDTWIHKEKNRDYGFHHEERFKLGVWLRKQPDFMNAPNKKQQHIIARQIFRDLTESEVAELVEIARMDINLEEIDSMRENFNKGASSEAVYQSSSVVDDEEAEEEGVEEESEDDVAVVQKSAKPQKKLSPINNDWVEEFVECVEDSSDKSQT